MSADDFSLCLYYEKISKQVLPTFKEEKAKEKKDIKSSDYGQDPYLKSVSNSEFKLLLSSTMHFQKLMKHIKKNGNGIKTFLFKKSISIFYWIN